MKQKYIRFSQMVVEIGGKQSSGRQEPERTINLRKLYSSETLGLIN